MTNSPPTFTPRHLLRIAMLPGISGGCCAALCYLFAGPTLGFFIGCIGLATLLTPPLILSRDSRPDQLLTAAAIIDSIALVWLFPLFTATLSLSQYLSAYLLLAVYVASLTGMVIFLFHLRIPLAFAVAGTVLLFLAWLTWPFWLPHSLANPALISTLVAPHPLLTLNGLLDLGNWTEQSIMYRHSRLNQDIAYSLPRSIWPCVALHGALAITFILAAKKRPEIS